GTQVVEFYAHRVDLVTKAGDRAHRLGQRGFTRRQARRRIRRLGRARDARSRMPTGACLAGWLLRLGHGPRLSPARASALREYKKGERPVADQGKPRPKAPTLVGVGPSSAPPVVGAVARPSRWGPRR